MAEFSFFRRVEASGGGTVGSFSAWLDEIQDEIPDDALIEVSARIIAPTDDSGAEFPEIVAVRNNRSIDRVEWHPGKEQAASLDLTPLHILEIERVVKPLENPAVKLTIRARLVESED